MVSEHHVGPGPTGPPLELAFEVEGWWLEISAKFEGRQGVLRIHNEAPAQAVPSDAAWSRYWQALDELGVWSWKPSYRPPPERMSKDGRGWSFMVRTAGMELASHGYEAYPPDGGEDDAAIDALVRATRRLFSDDIEIGPDELAHQAVSYAAARPVFGCGKKPEACLVQAIREAIEYETGLVPLPTEPRYELLGWHPGGVDLAVDLPQGRGRVLMEMKVDHPDESLWDAIKLAEIAAHRPTPAIAAAYLVYAARAEVWAAADESDFFDVSREWVVEELIGRWPEAWARLLIGGRGLRPDTSVSRLAATPLLSAELAVDSGIETRVLKISPRSVPQELRYTSDGWPEAFDPPAALRKRVQEADRKRLAGANGDAEEIDPCHGYPWYEKWSNGRLRAIVPELDDDAFRCLRTRLSTERRWTEEELSERVDPLRRTPGTADPPAGEREIHAKAAHELEALLERVERGEAPGRELAHALKESSVLIARFSDYVDEQGSSFELRSHVDIAGRDFFPIFTSPERLAAFYGRPVRRIRLWIADLLEAYPESVYLALNPVPGKSTTLIPSGEMLGGAREAARVRIASGTKISVRTPDNEPTSVLAALCGFCVDNPEIASAYWGEVELKRVEEEPHLLVGLEMEAADECDLLCRAAVGASRSAAVIDVVPIGQFGDTLFTRLLMEEGRRFYTRWPR